MGETNLELRGHRDKGELDKKISEMLDPTIEATDVQVQLENVFEYTVNKLKNLKTTSSEEIEQIINDATIGTTEDFKLRLGEKILKFLATSSGEPFESLVSHIGQGSDLWPSFYKLVSEKLNSRGEVVGEEGFDELLADFGVDPEQLVAKESVPVAGAEAPIVESPDAVAISEEKEIKICDLVFAFMGEMKKSARDFKAYLKEIDGYDMEKYFSRAENKKEGIEETFNYINNFRKFYLLFKKDSDEVVIGANEKKARDQAFDRVADKEILYLHEAKQLLKQLDPNNVLLKDAEVDIGEATEVTPQPPLVEQQIIITENPVEPRPVVTEAARPPVVESVPANVRTSPRELEEARKAYVAAKKRIQDNNSLVGFIKGVWNDSVLKKDTKLKLEDEYNRAKVAYEEARANYILANEQRWEESLNKFLDEKTKLVEERISQASKNWLLEKYDDYKNLSNKWNLAHALKIENRGLKFVLGSVNARSLASVGLLGLGVGFGGATAIGAGILAWRRIISVAATTAGSYELLNMAKGGLDRVTIAKNIENVLDVNELEDRLAKLEARVILDGKKLEVLQHDELYKKLTAQLETRYRADMGKLDGGSNYNELAKFLEFKSSQADAVLDEQIKKDKNYRRVAAVGAVGAGALAASGIPGRWLSKVTGISDLWQKYFGGGAVADKSLVTDQSPESVKPLSSVSLESAIEIKAGARGIEGALLDLQKTDPAKYHKMLEWMNAQKGGGLSTQDLEKDAGRIVHRFVNQFALDKGYTIGDGGTKDLNRMINAGMKLNSDGSIVFEEQGFKFMQPVEARQSVVTEPTDVTESMEPIDLAKIQEKARVVAEQALSDQGYKIGAEKHIDFDSSESPANTISGFESALDEGGNEVESTNSAVQSSNKVEKVSASAQEAELNSGSKAVAPVSKEPGQSYVEQAPKDYEQDKEDVEDLYSSEEKSNITKALETKDLTKSLKLVYGSEYGKLFKLGGFKPSELKKIQDWKLDEVLSKCATDKKFEKKFRLVHDSINLLRENINVDLSASLKTFLVKYSPLIKKAMP